MAERHIGNRKGQYVVVSIAPDVCKVGDALVPFDSFQDLSHEKSYITNVRAQGNPILTVDSIIAGTQSNAGKGIISDTSLGSGDCRILTGVDHIKCKGKAISRDGSLVSVNNDNTIGELHTQLNPANQEIPGKNTSFWERYGEQERLSEEFERESIKQEPDIIIALGKGYVNGWYLLGQLFAKIQMQNNIAQMEDNISLMQAMGMDTHLEEQANEANREVMETLNSGEPLLKPANETQAMAMEVEPYLELATGIAALTKGLLKFSGKMATKFVGRMGRNGVKIAEKPAGIKAVNFRRSMSERRKALLRDAKDPTSDLTEVQRKFIIDNNGYKVPEGVEVSHKIPLYTAKTAEGKKALDISDNMRTQQKTTHRNRHKVCGDQYHEYPRN